VYIAVTKNDNNYFKRFKIIFEMSDCISSNEIIKLICRPYSWKEKDRLDENDEKRLCIDIWCLDRQSEPLLLRIENFPCLCMVELPPKVNGYPKIWNKVECDILMSEISFLFKDKNGYSFAPYSYDFIKAENIYYFNNMKKYPYMQVFFKSIYNRNRFRNKLNSPVMTNSFGTIMLKVWETDVPNIRKIMTARKLEICQWLSVIATVPEEPISTIKEYLVSYKNLVGIPSIETESWQTFPKIIVFDYECHSHRIKAFPDSLSVLDATFMVSLICGRYMGGPDKIEKRINYIVVYGDINDIPQEKIEGNKVIIVDNEMDLFEEQGKIVKEYDPEMISGFNINKFDVSYFKDRHDLYEKKIFNSSRIPSEPTTIYTTEWESRAFGLVSASFFDDQGRITFDLFPYCERSLKLVRYNLNTVAKSLVNAEKDDVTPEFMFLTFKKWKKLTNKGITSGPEYQQVKDDLTTVAEYCIKDSVLVFDILEKTNMWIILNEYANASGVNIEDLYTRGQQISSFSLVYNEAATRGFVINHIDMKDMNMSGGFVRDPIKGLHDNTITLDFTSLYPTICISENLDYTTLVPPLMEPYVKDEDCNVHDFEQEEKIERMVKGKKKKEKVIRQYHFKYYKKRKGIVPSILEGLLNRRTAVKNQLKGEKDPIKRVVLDQRQLALKVRANSLFGFFGAKDGRLPLVPVAATITATGRKHIAKVDKYVMENHNARIVYNDTDSSFIQLFGISVKEIPAYGRQLAKDVSALFPDPVNMEYEKVFKVLCLKKKKYAGLPYNSETGELITDINKMMHKGIMSARRDNAGCGREIFIDTLYNSLIGTPVYDVVSAVYKRSLHLLDGKIAPEDLVIVKKLGAVYKDKNYSMKIFADRMKTLGNPIEPGDRIGFLVIKDETAKYMGEKMITAEMYKDNPEKYEIDYTYYLDKTISSHVDQVISIVYGEQLLETGIQFQANNRCKTVYFDYPIAYMCKMLKYNVDVRLLEPFIEELKVTIAIPKRKRKIKIKIEEV